MITHLENWNSLAFDMLISNPLKKNHSAHTIASMLAHRLQRWPNIKPTLAYVSLCFLGYGGWTLGSVDEYQSSSLSLASEEMKLLPILDALAFMNT